MMLTLLARLGHRLRRRRRLVGAVNRLGYWLERR